MKVVKVNANNLTKELYYLRQLHHPNIISLKHHFIINTQVYKISIYKSHFFVQNDEFNLHMVFPYIPCTLAHLIQNFKKNTPQTLSGTYDYNFLKPSRQQPSVLKKIILYQIARGIAYLHSKNIAHRDLNITNILLDLDTLEVKICDFGSAKTIQKGENSLSEIGAINNRAPEMLLGSRKYGLEVDLWSFACIIGELYLGKEIFSGNNSIEVLADVIKQIGTPTEQDLADLNAPFDELKMPPIQKLTMGLVTFKRFGQFKVEFLCDMLEALIVYSPKKRLSAFECLMHPFFNEIKHPHIKINHKSLPNIFNFTADEMNLELYKENAYRLIPSWHQEKEKRKQYMQTSN